MAKTPLIAAGKFSVRDYRDAKRDWSARLLVAPAHLRQGYGGQAAAAIPLGATRRAGAHATASATATRVVPTRRNSNVVGVGIAEKLVQGRPTGVLAVKFFVRTKFPTGAVVRSQALPKTIDGLPVDVEESGTFRAFAKRRQARGRHTCLIRVSGCVRRSRAARSGSAFPAISS